MGITRCCLLWQVIGKFNYHFEIIFIHYFLKSDFIILKIIQYFRF